MHIGKEEIRLSLFLGDMIVSLQGMQEIRFWKEEVSLARET